MTNWVNLLERIRALPEEEGAELLVEADTRRQAEPDADPLRRPLSLVTARVVVRNLKAGRMVYWS